MEKGYAEALAARVAEGCASLAAMLSNARARPLFADGMYTETGLPLRLTARECPRCLEAWDSHDGVCYRHPGSCLDFCGHIVGRNNACDLIASVVFCAHRRPEEKVIDHEA